MRILTETKEQNLINNPIYQTEKVSSLTDRYQLIRTDKVLEVFQDNGLQIDGKSFTKSRTPDLQGFKKHLISFSNPNLSTGDGQLQLLLTNSHDGSSSFQLDLGFFRFACANGLISGQADTCIKIRHTKNCLNKLDEAIRYQLDRLPQVSAAVDRWKQIDLSNSQIEAITVAATRLRKPTKHILHSINRPFPKRPEDRADNLWTIFNRLQELVIRGGLTYTIYNLEEKRLEEKRTRKVTSIDTVKHLNKELWNIAETYADEVAA